MSFESFSKTVCAAALVLAAGERTLPAQENDFERRLKALEEQNAKLQQTVQLQQEIISELKDKSGGLAKNTEIEGSPAIDLSFGRLHFSGEGAASYFHTGSEGAFPHGSFRVDEAKLFLEAPLWTDTYFFTELNLFQRETNDEYFELGELYVDFENVLRRWTEKSYLNIRVGRLDIPFGEEYLDRDAIDNPLISHSLSDLWGVDEGIEAYGSAGRVSYVVAVQNGGHPMLRDYDSDKSIAGRISYDPFKWLHLSASAMRTGNLDIKGDQLSEMWFGNGFFRSVGDQATTTRFDVNLYELDAQTYWKNGHLKLAGGYIEYDDDDRAADNRRDAWYYYAEAKQALFGKLYAATRFSEIIADEGLPLVGHGRFGRFFMSPLLTTELWRWSIGLGYSWNEHLLTKVEFTLEEGQLLGGRKREHENFVGAQVAFKF